MLIRCTHLMQMMVLVCMFVISVRSDSTTRLLLHHGMPGKGGAKLSPASPTVVC